MSCRNGVPWSSIFSLVRYGGIDSVGWSRTEARNENCGGGGGRGGGGEQGATISLHADVNASVN